MERDLINPIANLTSQLKNDTNVATNPLTDLSIEIGQYEFNLE